MISLAVDLVEGEVASQVAVVVESRPWLSSFDMSRSKCFRQWLGEVPASLKW
jgi:hypothetical protein